MATSMGEPRAERRKSRVFSAPDLSVPGTILSPVEVRFFQENGFLVKHALLDREAMAAAVERTWEHLLEVVPQDPSSGWRLNPRDPSTWQNPRWAPMPPHPTSGEYEGRAPVEYHGGVVKLHLLGREASLLASFANHARVLAVVRALLGGELRETRFFRGVYPIFPTRQSADDRVELERRPLAPHTDRVCQQVNVCAYLDDVAPRSGGFTVYPGSHLRLFSEHRYEANWSPLPSYESALAEVAATVEPLELSAALGSVIFWHGRLVHSGGIHFGRHIRWAAFADYTHDRPTLTDDEHRALGLYEWFKDVKLFREDFEASSDPWRHWAIGASQP
jgi:hypothetical protein